MVVGGQWAALTTEAKEGRGSREGGVGLEPERQSHTEYLLEVIVSLEFYYCRGFIYLQ